MLDSICRYADAGILPNIKQIHGVAFTAPKHKCMLSLFATGIRRLNNTFTSSLRFVYNILYFGHRWLFGRVVWTDSSEQRSFTDELLMSYNGPESKEALLWLGNLTN